MPNLNRDNEGRVIPYEDPNLNDNEILFRRIPPGAIHPNTDGTRRVSPSGFSASSRARDVHRGMSVDLRSELQVLGIHAEELGYHPATEVIMSLRVGDLRQAGHQFLVGRDPTPENPAHCNVWGVLSTSQKKYLLQLADWVRRPDDVIKEKR